ncbi:MAG TPA: hypothetical protein VK939_03990 [Longimicrobiales bacterium]|nr:hypothetical protein [Longimicrobiales bacterium]
MEGNGTTGTIRRLLLAVVLLGMAGTAAELVLLEHYESTWQLVPLATLAVGAALTLLVLLQPTRGAVLALRGVLLAFLVVGGLGLWRHYAGNVEFELERHPERAGLVLLWAVLRGATPALAPGTMIQIGLFGLIALFRHPVAASPAPPARGA